MHHAHLMSGFSMRTTTHVLGSLLCAKIMPQVSDYITRCDFNNNSKPFCDWVQPCEGDNGNWIRTKHDTPTLGTGPDKDYPNGGGYFIYQEASNFVPSELIRLESEEITVSGEICIDFWYHMLGSEDLNELKVLVKDYVTETEVIFEAIRGLTDFGDTAIDNVAIRRGNCATGCALDCNFDIDLCDWMQSKTDNFDWKRISGSTPSANTGPSFDHTTAGGYYIYIEGNEAKLGERAHLVSAPCAKRGAQCLRFWYHMYGVARSMALKVYLVEGGTPILMWSETGNKGNKWIAGEVGLHLSGNSQILIEGIRGDDYRSDIAVDDISFHSGCCGDECVTTSTTSIPTTVSTVTPDITESSCTVQGDPHYNTFDKQAHDFMGTCTYTLSKLCDADSTLPYFNVEAANEHRSGNSYVSYVKNVNINVYNHRITLEKGHVVKVDGEVEVLPVSVTSGVLVGLSGQYVIVTTDFGLRVKFDGRHRAEVTLPSIFKGKVCGMCGNYNDDGRDDFLNPDGGMEADSVSLGNSWQTQNDTRCTPDTGLKPNCTEGEKHIIESKDYCGIIMDSHGPFKECHSVVDPSVYFVDCVYDLCALDLKMGSLCSSLQSYADACQAKGVRVEAWRNETFCPLKCGVNSHYEQCGSACPATCVNPNAPSSCSQPCVEGCVCDSGYVFYNDRCVLRSQCGCWSEGKHYPVGSEFWTDDTCSTKCRCPSAGSKVVCSSSTCSKDSYCGVVNGVPGCYSYVYGICRVHNDPHYNTFDKATHHFMGRCTYTIAKLCSNSSSLPYFNIEAKNENRGNAKVSYVQRVTVAVHGHNVRIVKRESHRVLVDKEWTTLPVTLVDGAVSVSRSGRYVVLATDFGLHVSYDTDHSVEVKVPSTYFNKTCGMCGNYNGLRMDDYMKPDGEQAKDSNELGNSWKVPPYDPGCDPGNTEECQPADENLYQSDDFCGLITSQQGPFVKCHSVINPSGTFESCVVELCLLQGNQDAFCNTLQIYADACQSAGVTIPPWKNSTFCHVECPTNSHYNACASACPATCTDHFAPGNCSKPCVEDCQCNDGFVLSGSLCVSVENCGCVHNKKYYEKGAMFWEDGCLRRCRCAGNDQVECEAGSCRPEEICKVQDGVLGCYRAITVNCHIYGDPHYTTFDGKLYHFQGACNYTVTETCGNTSVQFSVTSRNEHRGSPTWSAINSVALQLNGLHVALRKNKLVYVDGVRVELPVSPSSSVRVSMVGSFVMVQTNFGLQLKFNGDHELFVVVDERYKGQLCGLCGTYTDDQLDDFLKPDGILASDSNQFGDSWIVIDDDWLCNHTAPLPPTCEPSSKEEAERYCKIILASDGPFKNCHWYIPPQLYFESCVYDHCATGGDSALLCNALESYASVCEAAGVVLADWREQSGCVEESCALDCNFDIDLCDWMQSKTDNFDWKRISGSTPSANTGPSFDHTTAGGYYIYIEGNEAKVGERAHLVSAPCAKRGAQCLRFWYHMYGVARSMALKVYLVEESSCTVQGDPHYNTFDKQAHDFMGMCTYTLSKLCDADSTLPYFNVEAANEHRSGNSYVSYVKNVNINVYNHRITLEKGHVVKVDGEVEVLPVSVTSGVLVGLSGQYVIVTTDFGLRVKFDGRHRAEVTLPSIFKGKVCGMCGNYNDDGRDDFLNPDGGMEADSVSLGNSWQTQNDTRCTPDTGLKPNCTEGEKHIIESKDYCGIIMDSHGPFKECHSVVDPSVYFVDCVYDLCALDLKMGSLCSSLQSYADACQAKGVRVEAWRNETFCPLKCGVNSHYEQCGSACPATCVNPNAPSSCSQPCVEGCVCDSGYVFYNDRCVLRSQCGCWSEGKHYPVGSEFWTDDTCSTKCRCPSAGSKVVCSSSTCSKDSYCGVVNGVPGCYSYVYGICRVHNDPHYNTFDKATHHFMGRCTYTIAKLCSNSSSLPYFNIEAKNENRGNAKVSYVQRVTVAVHGHNVRIVKRESHRVLVDEEWTTLPVTLVDGAVSVSRSGRYVVLATDFGLHVSYDTDHSVEVKVPSTYFNKTCGMCGNYNRLRMDDYMKPDGEQAKDSNELGNSWKVPPYDPGCDPGNTEECQPADENLYQSDDFCGLITSQQGPFVKCHSVINPSGTFESCVVELCLLQGKQDAFCNTLQIYADACQSAGVTIPPWKNSTFCHVECPTNSHYNACASACPATCTDHFAPGNCSKPCVEDCQCNDGFVLSGSLCVSVENCGCVHNKKYYEKGAMFWEDGCLRRCRCAGNDQVECEAGSCRPEEICKVQDGVLGCYRAITVNCHIYGDPHYTTFDGKLYHFQGACNYTVTETCGNTSVQFSVTSRNEHRGSPTWSAINSVALQLNGLHVALRKNKLVYVDGVRVELPVSPSSSVRVSMVGSFVMVQTNFGLQLKFNGDHELFVVVDERYKGQLCGLCGTYTDDQLDDFLKPDGILASDSNQFGDSWIVIDDDWLCNHTAPLPPTCEPSSKEEAERYCKIILASDGPFKNCHWYIPPQLYFESCVYDHCATGGDSALLCNALESYASVCEAAGVVLADWREQSGCVEESCALDCNFDIDLCDWMQSKTDNFDWKRISGSTPSANTGPSFDHTTAGGYYIYIEGNEAKVGERAHLVSAPCAKRGAQCLRFWYHMYGVARSMALKVYLVEESSCTVQGDPHYNTFDKQAHDFMGTCTYTLSKLCDADSTLPYFNVEAANEHRSGNSYVSYVKNVNINVYNHRITLEKGHVVKVDGEVEVLPVSVTSGVLVGLSGQYVIVTTDFGLRVKFDGRHRAEVTLPSIFKGKVCGMCGNYNDDGRDDFLNPDGGMEADSVSLGNSWQTQNDTRCTPDTGLKPNCTEGEKHIIESKDYCGIIMDSHGPFKECHSVVDPSVYFVDCVYDLCALDLKMGSLCSSLQSYADACQAKGVRVEAWRNETFCPLKCGVNSHYEQCGSACPATCVNPNAPSSCSQPCVEGCVCDTGYVFYNDRCVLRSQCGCWSEGKHYPVGSEFWTDDTCSTKCRCPSAGSKVVCSSSTCSKDSYCGVVNGVPGCYSYVYGICRVHNDPHYNTFDKATHHFMGRCTYTIAKLCSNSSSLPYFNIEAKNENRGNAKVSYVQRVTVAVHGHNVRIVKRESHRVLVDEEWTTLPVTLVDGAVSVSRSGRYVVLATDFGLHVSYDTDHSVEVKVPSTYFNKTCGMCGNYNGLRMDDYMKPDGEQAKDSNELGNSWKVPPYDPGCDPGNTEECQPADENLYQSDDFCGLITSQQGPFVKCHSVINPSGTFESCVVELCLLQGKQDAFCNTLQIYADACQSAGVTIPPWKNSTFCHVECPTNSHYNACASACPATCTDHFAPGNCSKPCVEDCQCNDGFVLSGSLCVSVENCGCVHNKKYYEKGAMFWEDGCLRRCRCAGNDQVECEAGSCRPEEICKVQDGVLGCYRAITVNCHIYGDPHYTTFDGKLYHFQGACNYTVTETCGNTSVQFSVTSRNEHRGSPTWSAINSVALQLNGLHVALRKNKLVYVDGVRVELPVSPSSSVRVSMVGSFVMVQTNFGLQLKFNGDHELFVVVDERYKGQLCGLCGTYTDDQLDDFLKPDGILASDSNQFGDSWIVIDDDWLCNNTAPLPPTCEPSSKEEAERYCKIILASDGPFKNCHWYIPPQLYFESCVYDHCATGGDSALLCNALESYASVCEAAGVVLADWREQSGCVEESCALDCNFDIDLCDWMQSKTDNFDWKRISGSTPSANTGPSFDHTTAGGYYIYIEGNEAKVGERAHLVSAPCAKRGAQCLRFWYHMYGVARSMALKVYLVEGGTPILMWSETGNKGNKWIAGEVGLHLSGNSQILIEGIRGDDYRSDIAVDDISFHSGCCGDECVTTSTTSIPTAVGTLTPDTTGKLKACDVEPSSLQSYLQWIICRKLECCFLNGKRVNLPVSVKDHLVVRMSGAYVLLETNFGLLVRFDGIHHVDVSVPSAYTGLLCGMCGNYNGDPDDDIIMPNGSLAADSNKLGESWQVPDGEIDSNLHLHSSFNIEKHPKAIHRSESDFKCDPKIKENAEKDNACGMITDLTGLFKECHAKVPPKNYFDNCVFDMCMNGGQSTIFCFALQTYADLCAQVGVCREWRNNTFCPLSCPGGSHYERCGTSCPATCTDLSAPDSCPLPTVEGCFCDPGYVLSVDKCVPSSQCGCVDENNKYYQLNESWFTYENCTERCTCVGKNSTTCTVWKCGVLEKCERLDGELGCQMTGYASCHVAGDPHYYTFDKIMYTFSGTCAYTLVKMCDNSSVIPVSISALNEGHGQPLATHLREIYIDVYGVHLTLQKNRRILLDGERTRMPIQNCVRGVNVVTNGIYTIVETDFGMSVKFDGNHNLEINLPNSYYSKVCGMCGNYNGQKADELLMPDGLIAPDVTHFGNSWKSEEYSNAGAQFFTVKASSPVFSEISFTDNCFFPEVSTPSQHKIYPLKETLHCPPKSYYVTCAPACPPTCNNIYAGSSCDKPSMCIEGCVCDNGFVLSDDSCVPISECGCRDKNDDYHRGPLDGNQECLHIILLLCVPDIFFSLGFNKCTIGRDPYYLAFDGLVHHFADLGADIAPGGSDAGSMRHSCCLVTYLIEAQHGDLATMFAPDITHPVTYKNWVRGLCGNFDGMSKNYLTKPDGTRITEVKDFGASWEVDRNRPATGEPEAAGSQRRHPITDEDLENIELDTEFDLQCSKTKLKLINSTSYCGIISDPVGPFNDCHRFISPEQYQM
ncbi:IgGFc-binding protein-like [Heptranchias perlo]|uniref:IgGFc-binding protein-like n=1 Tax=Heptranchias perlo TaxID=212740 RepID=UPI00355A2D6C